MSSSQNWIPSICFFTVENAAWRPSTQGFSALWQDSGTHFSLEEATVTRPQRPINFLDGEDHSTSSFLLLSLLAGRPGYDRASVPQEG